MKRALFLVPLALGGALWLVNWKLDHPPQTKADLAFARLVKGGDEVEISTFSGQRKISLRGARLASLLDCLHFDDAAGLATQGYDSYYTLRWKKAGVVLGVFDTDFGHSPPALWQTNASSKAFNYSLTARSGRRFEALIGEALPAEFR